MQNRKRSYERLNKLSHWLDESINIPGTAYRVGWEPIIGLIPVGGDVITGLISFYIIAEAIKLKAPAFVIVRMLLNAAVDIVIGTIPFAGDIFDFGWKANTRNIDLLRRYVMDPEDVEKESKWRVGWVGLASSILLIAIVGLVVFLLWFLGGLVIDGLQAIWLQITQ